jgi:hypothetical protein
MIRALARLHEPDSSGLLGRNARRLATHAGVLSRPGCLTLDAMITARLGPSFFPVHGSPRSEAGTPSYKRAQRWINLAAALLPATYDRLTRQLIDTTLLPFANGNASLLNFGSGATVFLLSGAPAQEEAQGMVMKVFRKSLGLGLQDLMLQARDRSHTYARISQWYQGCAFILPTHFLILHGPLISRPAVVCIQPFVAGEHIDPLHDLSQHELFGLLREQPRLGREFVTFVDRTLQAADTEQACVDLVGHNNLVITRSSDDYRLVLLDHGIYDFERKRRRSPAALGKLQTRLNYLRQVRDRLAAAERG